MEQMGKNTKNELKIIVVGNSGTGKTSFVNKWIKDTFDENYKATIVSEFSYKIIEYKDKSYKIQLWDLAGMDQNICITKIFSKDSHGCIVLSDITDEKTLNECIKWKNTVDENTKFLDGTNIPSILIRNKVDLLENEDNNDDEEQMKEFCEKNSFLRSFKTSAKMGTNIDEAMNFLIHDIIDKMEKLAQNGNNPFEKDRKSLVLQPKKHTENAKENSGMGGCC
jgi:small GTP-binding protein